MPTPDIRLITLCAQKHKEAERVHSEIEAGEKQIAKMKIREASLRNDVELLSSAISEGKAYDAIVKPGKTPDVEPTLVPQPGVAPVSVPAPVEARVEREREVREGPPHNNET